MRPRPGLSVAPPLPLDRGRATSPVLPGVERRALTDRADARRACRDKERSDMRIPIARPHTAFVGLLIALTLVLTAACGSQTTTDGRPDVRWRSSTRPCTIGFRLPCSSRESSGSEPTPPTRPCQRLRRTAAPSSAWSPISAPRSAGARRTCRVRQHRLHHAACRRSRRRAGPWHVGHDGHRRASQDRGLRQLLQRWHVDCRAAREPGRHHRHPGSVRPRRRRRNGDDAVGPAEPDPGKLRQWPRSS